MTRGPDRPPDQFDAVILRLQPLRDADLIGVLLSAELGKSEVYARNARKPSKRFGGRLEAFVAGTVTVGRGRGSLANLRGFQPRERLLPTGTGYEQLALASYFAELAIVASQPAHADPLLHAWFVSAAGCAGKTELNELAVLKLAGEIAWLAAVGALADPTTCDECGLSTQEGGHWTSATAGPICSACGPPVAPAIGPDLLLAVNALSSGHVDPQIVQQLAQMRPETIEVAINARVAELLARPSRSLRGLQDQFSLAQPP